MNEEMSIALKKIALEQIEIGIINLRASKISTIEEEHLGQLSTEFRKIKRLLETRGALVEKPKTKNAYCPRCDAPRPHTYVKNTGYVCDICTDANYTR